MRRFKNLQTGNILTITPIGDEMEWWYSENQKRYRDSQKTVNDIYHHRRLDMFMPISIKYYYNAIGSI